MTERKVAIQTGKNRSVEGIWVDSFFDKGGYAVVIDDDGDVHLVSFRDVRVIE